MALSIEMTKPLAAGGAAALAPAFALGGEAPHDRVGGLERALGPRLLL
jgi:hypothetical protein